MVIDFDLVPVSDDAPRILWRNTVMDEQPTSDYDIFIDPMTWNLDTVPASIDLDLSPRPIACNAIGIARANWQGQVISVFYDDGFGWIEAGTWQPVPGQPFLGLFDFQTAALWRITVSGSALIASVIRLGMALSMQRNTYGGVEPITKRVNTTPKNQLGAHFVGRQVEQTRREQAFNFSKLSPEWVRAYFKPFTRDAKSESAFVAWRPSTYPQDVIYGFCDDDVKPSNEMANGMMKVSFNIEGGEL